MKYAWIEQHRDDYPVARLCRQLEVSRKGYCQWRRRAPSPRAIANAVLDVQVAVLHARSHRSYGRPRIVRGLRDQGVRVSPERVRKSLLRQGLRPVYTRPYRVTTAAAHRQPIAPMCWRGAWTAGSSIRPGSATLPLSRPAKGGSTWPA